MKITRRQLNKIIREEAGMGSCDVNLEQLKSEMRGMNPEEAYAMMPLDRTDPCFETYEAAFSSEHPSFELGADTPMARGEGEMKESRVMSRQELRALLLREMQLSTGMMAAVKRTLDAEGGAASMEQIGQAAKDADETGASADIDPETIARVAVDQDEDLGQHEKGGAVDPADVQDGAINESTRITRQTLRQIIQEEISKASPFGSGMKQAKLDKDLKQVVGHT